MAVFRPQVELGAYLGNMHVERSRREIDRIVPDFFKDVSARQGALQVLEEQQRKFKLLCRQAHYLVIKAHGLIQPVKRVAAMLFQP